MSNLSSHKELEKEEQNKYTASRRKEIIKTRARISEIVSRKTVEKTNGTKSLVLRKDQ